MDISFIAERIYPHEYVFVSTKDVSRKTTKPEQESNRHLPIIDRTFYQLNYPIFSPAKNTWLYIWTFIYEIRFSRTIMISIHLSVFLSLYEDFHSVLSVFAPSSTIGRGITSGHRFRPCSRVSSYGMSVQPSPSHIWWSLIRGYSLLLWRIELLCAVERSWPVSCLHFSRSTP
jgi:hypothetical protein